MPHPMTLPLIAGLSVFGTALGVHFGRSAVDLINPAYFTDPEVPFHADLAPYRSPDWAQVQAAEYQLATAEGLGSGCIGCRDYPVAYVPAAYPTLDGAGDGWSASTVYAEPAAVDQEAPAPAPDPDRERIARYASYPIEAEEEPSAVEDDQDYVVYAGTD